MPTGPDPKHNPRDPRPLLVVRDLRVCFKTDAAPLIAVDGVNLIVHEGETLGLVGESGCGKSVTAFSILRLLQSPPAEITGGEIDFEGQKLLDASERELRSIRGKLISMVFQEPMTSLNPIITIGKQVAEALLEHEKLSKRDARQRAIEMLGRVGMPSPETRFDEYPHQLSGGMKQRAMIAMALICRPHLLIADEPTTALDVTIQAQILDLLKELQRDFKMAVLLITHDLGLVAENCTRVAIMYAGKIVEQAPVTDLFDHPMHPYTRGLFRSLPVLASKNQPLPTIPGVVPNPLDFPSGCRFRTRCPMATEKCLEEPALREMGPQHYAACHYAEDVGAQGNPLNSSIVYEQPACR